MYNTQMNIIIAGAGHVGYELAKTLSIYNNVVVIDKDALTLSSLNDTIDILPIHGDVEDPSTYQKLIDREFDLFIAVTDRDEANLISTIIASDVIDAKTNIIRLRNHFFARSSLMKKFNINEALFPIELTANKVVKLLKYPKAENVKKFKHTDKVLISLRVSNIEGPTEIIPKGYVVVGIERGKKFFIPDQKEPIHPNDLIYLFGDEIAIHHFCQAYVKDDSGNNQRVVIFGADELGVKIAQSLIQEGKDVKLIDNDLKVCKRANEELSGEAIVLNSKYGLSSLYENEGLEHADVAIATTKNDEFNIIKCLEAREKGIKHVVSINNDLEHYPLMHSLDIVVVRGPKISTYNAILEKIHSTKIVTQRYYCGGRGRVYMHKIVASSGLINKKLNTIKQKENLAIYLVRDGKITVCDKSLLCQEDDLIVAFCTQEHEEAVKKWMHSF